MPYNFKCKLKRGDEIIDEHVTCIIHGLRRRKPLSSIFEGEGEIDTSKTLPIGQMDISMDMKKGQFILIFDPPVDISEYGILDKLYINITYIEEPLRRCASFDLKRIIG